MEGEVIVDKQLMAEFEAQYFKEYMLMVDKAFGWTFGIHKRRRKGETRIFNKCKYIMNEQIKQCINLLHPTYDSMGIDAYFYQHKLQPFYRFVLSRNRSLSTYKEVLSTKIGGQHNAATGTVSFYDWGWRYPNRTKDEILQMKKLMLVFVLYHELRHGWQDKYREEKYNQQYISLGKGYESQWHERDANHFAQRMMNNNKDEINKILNITLDWTFIWKYIQLNTDRDKKEVEH